MTRNVSSKSFGRCLRALEHERRRAVVAALRNDDSLGMAAFATDEENRLALVHRHLPLLADGGYVDWDRERDRVRRGPRFDDIDTLLELLRTHEDDLPWPVV